MMQRITAILAMVFSIAGCGGGGGGSGPGPVSPPPPGPAQLALTAQNASDVGVVAMAGAEGAVQLGLAALDGIFDFADSGRLATNVDCVSGTIGNTLIDNDGSGTISGGDTVEMDFNNCHLLVLGLPITGRITVDVDSLTIFSDLSVNGQMTARFPQPLQFAPQNGVSTSVSGSLALSFTASDDVDNLLVETLPGGVFEVQIVAGGQTDIERFTDVRVSRVIDENDIYVLDIELTADSGIAGGRFSCTTPTSLGALVGFFPTSGLVECAGASNSKVRLVPVSINVLSTRADPEGDGTFVDVGVPANGNGNWGDYIEGSLVVARIPRPQVDRSRIIPTVSGPSFDISVNDAVYGAATGMLYVSNDVAVVEFDPVNQQPGRSVALNGRGGPVAISDDGSTLWVGLQDVSEIMPIDTATMTAGATVALGVSQAPVGDRFAADIEVAPGTLDTVVVAMEDGWEIVAYAAGVQLPNTVLDSGAANHIEFSDSTTIIGIEDDSTAFSASRVTLDANGLTLDKSLRRFSFGFNSELALGNEYAFTDSGRVIDVPNENVVGRILFGGLPSSRDGVYVDKPAGIAYFYDDSTNTLDFYDENRLVPLGVYRLNSSGVLIRILETSDNQLLFVFDTGIKQISKDVLLTTFLSDPCATTDFSGQLGPNFFIQISCAFNDAIYDEARDLIYATTPSSNGPGGNSVAVVSPATGIVLSTIFVGSEPTRLSMSATGSLLYVVLSESTTVAVVDLQTQALTTPVKTKLLQPYMQPSIPEVVTASPVLDAEILISDGGEIDIYSAGIPSANGTLRASQVEALYYRSDGQVAWAIELGRKFWEYAIDPLGLTDLREVRDAVQPRGLKIQNDLFYDLFGAVIDPVTLTVIGTCPVVSTGAVEPDLNGLYAYYWRQGSRSKLVACDLSSFSIGGDFDIPNFGGSVGDVRAFVLAGSNRLVIVAFDKMLFLDPAEIRAVP